jgi:hypothetical protein
VPTNAINTLNSSPAATVTASVTQRLHQMVSSPADQVIILRANPALSLPRVKRPKPYSIGTYKVTKPVSSKRIPFEEAVTKPVVHNLVLKYPIQTGSESMVLRCKTGHIKPQLKTVNCRENLNLMSQIPLRWPLITLDQLDEATCLHIGKHVRQALKHDPMATYWRTQGVYAPVYRNKVFKVLRHPSGYLIGLANQSGSAVSLDEPIKLTEPHYVVWLSAGKSKSHLVWVPMKGHTK